MISSAYMMVLVSVPQAKKLAIHWTVSFCTNCAIVIGNISTDDAKMIGITPAWFTFRGICVV